MFIDIFIVIDIVYRYAFKPFTMVLIIGYWVMNELYMKQKIKMINENIYRKVSTIFRVWNNHEIVFQICMKIIELKF